MENPNNSSTAPGTEGQAISALKVGKVSPRFTNKELEIIKQFVPIFEHRIDRILSDLYNFCLQFPDVRHYFQGEGRASQLREMLHEWLSSIFQGPFDERYSLKLQRLRHTQISMGFPIHAFSRAIIFLQLNMWPLIEAKVEPESRENSLLVVEKVLELNRDIFLDSPTKQTGQMTLFFKVHHFLIKIIRRFVLAFDLLLVLGLICLALASTYEIIYEIGQIIGGYVPGKNVIGVLGSLLVLWIVIELLEAEVDRLRGGTLKLNLFIGAALIAFIRKILLATMSFDNLKMEIFYLASILVLGLIFWLISVATSRVK